MSYTKGPWNNYAGDDIYCVYDASGKKICSIEPVDIVGWNAVHRQEAEANEALISAAPCLLEALIDIADDYSERFDMDSPSTNPGMKQVVAAARAAIAKAKGEVK